MLEKDWKEIAKSDDSKMSEYEVGYREAFRAVCDELGINWRNEVEVPRDL